MTQTGENAQQATGRRPHPALAQLIPAYWGYRYEAPAPVWRREPPMGVVTVVLNLGGGFDTGWVGDAPHRGHRVAPVSSFIAGVHDTAAFTADPGGQRGIEFNLSPLGAYSLLGLPAREFVGEVVPLEAVLGPGAAGLVERVAEAPDWESRFGLLDAALLRRLDGAAEPHPDVAHAWSLLAAGRGQVGVAELCRATGRSRRHLAARFGEQVGLAPKTMARVLRFRAAMGMLRTADPVPLAEVITVGATYCKNPTEASGILLAPAANRSKGIAVTMPPPIKNRFSTVKIGFNENPCA